ncbi:MAG TPA: SGNH/GDSL hydrolase family protein, partial [Polyangiaceae bacterium]|nr:SGNH/GDSL hydrolase family protein [Polyangiaceae bacterium]
FFLRIMSDFAKPDANAASRERFRRVCEEAGVEVIDVYPAFQPHEFSDEFIVFPGDLHPNARAHARFAAAAADALRPRVAATRAAPAR